MFLPDLLQDKKSIDSLQVQPASRGFTLIELMIVLAVLAILVALAIPTYSDYSIRARIAESLATAAAAKTAVSTTCQEDLNLTSLTNSKAGYGFEATEFVSSIVVGGVCSAPIITMTTQATGAQPDPVLTLTGDFTLGSGRITWICVSSGPNIHVPKTCRS